MKNINDDTRPFGYWITAVDRLLRAEFATVFEDEGITRRDWRMLNRIDGTVPAADDRPLTAHRLRRLTELDWVRRTPGGWELTEAGALAKQRLGTAVDELRGRVADALSPEEYAGMTASLQKVARAFGWAEDRPLPHRRGRHDRRHAGAHGHHRGHHRDHDHGQGHGHGHDDHGDHRGHDDLGEHRGHGRQRFGRHGSAHSHSGDCGHRGRFAGHGAPVAHHIHIHHHG